jgi:hypothetical protein
VDAEDGLADVVSRVKAVIAEAESELLIILRAKTAVAFETGGELWALKLFANVNFGMYFQRNHFCSPQRRRATNMPTVEAWRH